MQVRCHSALIATRVVHHTPACTPSDYPRLPSSGDYDLQADIAHRLLALVQIKDVGGVVPLLQLVDDLPTSTRSSRADHDHVDDAGAAAENSNSSGRDDDGVPAAPHEDEGEAAVIMINTSRSALASQRSSGQDDAPTLNVQQQQQQQLEADSRSAASAAVDGDHGAYPDRSPRPTVTDHGNDENDDNGDYRQHQYQRQQRGHPVARLLFPRSSSAGNNNAASSSPSSPPPPRLLSSSLSSQGAFGNNTPGAGYAVGGYVQPRSIDHIDAACLAEAKRLLFSDDPATAAELASMINNDAVIQMALSRTGVEVSKLMPRPLQSFRRDAADTTHDLKMRSEQYDQLRILNLALVLDDRQAAAMALASQQAEFAHTAMEVRRAVMMTMAREEERMAKSKATTEKLKAVIVREESTMAELKRRSEIKQAELEKRLQLKEQQRQAGLKELAKKAAARAETIAKINEHRAQMAKQELENAKRSMEEKEQKRLAALAEQARRASTLSGASGVASSGAAAAAAASSANRSPHSPGKENDGSAVSPDMKVKIAAIKAAAEAEKQRLIDASKAAEARVEAERLKKQQAMVEARETHLKREQLRKENAGW